MAIRSGGQEGEPITEINMTPLVDVSLVLVIIFMAVAPLVYQAGISVLSSRTGVRVGQISSARNVQVRLTAKGRIWVNEKSVKKEQLAAVFFSEIPKTKDRMVIVSAEPGNRVGEVVELLDLAKQCGAEKVGIVQPR